MPTDPALLREIEEKVRMIPSTAGNREQGIHGEWKIMKFLSLICGLAAALLLSAQDFTPSKTGADSAPEGWKVYGKGPGRLRMEGGTLRITDLSPVNEWGVWRSFPAARPGKYEVSAEYTGEADGAQLVLIAGKETRVFHLKRIPDNEIVRLNLPTAIPYVFEFDHHLNLTTPFSQPVPCIVFYVPTSFYNHQKQRRKLCILHNFRRCIMLFACASQFSDPEGRWFESSRAHHNSLIRTQFSGFG